jgi:hypothetical protein
MAGPDTNNLAIASEIPESIIKYITRLLKTPADFSSTQRSYGHGYSHPSLGLAPGGQWLDPMQLNNVYSQQYQGERGDIAQQDITQKMSLTDLLTKAGSSFAQLQNTIPFLNAQNVGSGGGGPFGGLGGLF